MKAILMADLTPLEKIIEEIRGIANPVNVEARDDTPLPMGATKSPPNPTEASRFSPPRKQDIHVVSAGRDAPKATPPYRNDATLWKDLLGEIKGSRPNLASYLDQGILLEVGEKTVQLQFSEESSFLISLIEKKENKKILKPLLKNYFKRELELVLKATAVEVPVAAATSTNNLLVEEALKVFGGAILK
jgi:hypothetical protein